jgi:1A family penicillin-binding protein
MTTKGKKPRLVAENRYPKTGSAKKAAKKKPVTKRKKTPTGKKHGNLLTRLISGLIGFVVTILWRIFWRGALAIVLMLAIGIGYYTQNLKPYEQLLDGRAKGSVTLLDQSGAVFAWRGEQFGGIITANTVSPHLKNAIIATEDRRFYRHFGISPRGLASAIRINLREGRGPLSGHGGSTLTQQTAKLLCMGTQYDPQKWKNERAYERECQEGSLWRKVREATFALALELKYTKDEILTIYLARAYLGAGARGFEAASHRYFGKSAAEVTVSEAAMLAGLLVAPSRYAPTNNLKRSQERANLIIGLMEAQGHISSTSAQLARINPAKLSDAAAAQAGGYFADWVMQEAPDFLTRTTTEDVIIQTTLDQNMQAKAEDALKWVFDNKVSPDSKAQAAIVVMSADGAVRAMVGGRQTKVAGAFNRATQALRQTGSAFKPFVYATALDLGYSPMDTVVDEPITLNIPGSGPWSPKNYTKEFYGTVTLNEALRQSLNIPAVSLSEAVGRENVRRVASNFGISADLAQGPAIALGASESTLIEMTGAYAGILNQGLSVTPHGITDLRLSGDNSLFTNGTQRVGEQVVLKQTARDLIFMMENVVRTGTGQRAGFGEWEIAGKTGTTQGARDAWFIGFTADYVAGVWMGYDDNTPLTGVTGGGLPAEIWRETMQRIHEDIAPKPLPMSRDISSTRHNDTPVQNNTSAESNTIDRLLRSLFEVD